MYDSIELKKDKGKYVMVKIQGLISKNNLKEFKFEIKSQLIIINNSNGTGKTTLLKCICNLQEYDGIINDYGKKIKIEDISYYFTGDEFLEQSLSVNQNCRYLLKKMN